MNGSFSPRPSVPPVVKALLIISVAAWLLTVLLKESAGIDLMDYFALYSWESKYFRPWQLFTYLFLHDDKSIFHLLFNMFGLWMFGSVLERFWGPKRFLTYFLFTGIGAGIIHLSISNFQLRPMKQAAEAYMNAPSYEAFDSFTENYLPNSFSNDALNSFMEKWYYRKGTDEEPSFIRESKLMVTEIAEVRSATPSVGSSGALYGMLLAFGMLFPNAMIMLMIPPIPMKAKYFVIVFGGMELLMGLRNSLTDNVAHFAHLGGMVFGIILILLWRKQDKNRNVYMP
ncbi:MAG: rhomboid family intramembrane serine protease [Bacteroidia bacterium]